MPGTVSIAKLIPWLLAIALCSLAIGGCATRLEDRDGARAYVILGFGVITIEPPDRTNTATIIDSRVFGIQFATEPSPSLGVGYLRATTYYVPSNFGYLADAADSRRSLAQAVSAPSLGLDYLRATTYDGSSNLGIMTGNSGDRPVPETDAPAQSVPLDGPGD